jgi:hypothetical protein
MFKNGNSYAKKLQEHISLTFYEDPYWNDQPKKLASCRHENFKFRKSQKVFVPPFLPALHLK